MWYWARGSSPLDRLWPPGKIRTPESTRRGTETPVPTRNSNPRAGADRSRPSQPRSATRQRQSTPTRQRPSAGSTGSRANHREIASNAGGRQPNTTQRRSPPAASRNNSAGSRANRSESASRSRGNQPNTTQRRSPPAASRDNSAGSRANRSESASRSRGNQPNTTQRQSPPAASRDNSAGSRANPRENASGSRGNQPQHNAAAKSACAIAQPGKHIQCPATAWRCSQGNTVRDVLGRQTESILNRPATMPEITRQTSGVSRRIMPTPSHGRMCSPIQDRITTPAPLLAAT